MEYIITISILLLLSLTFYFLKKNKNSLLENPKNYYFGMENIDGISLDNPLMKTMKDFCEQNEIYKNGAVISLSGGVDSMVTLACLMKISQIYLFPIYTASIDYAQREDQSREIEFLENYCKKHNIKTFVSKVEGFSRKKETSGKRTEFEEESRKIRFDLYKNIINNYSGNGIFVGHHKDDIIENIFTNSMKGGNLLDLEVMKPISTIHTVNIYRPFLHFHKDTIFEFAHKYNIPYFIDTTPKWSRRGKMRNEIFPLLDNVFGHKWRHNLKEIGEQSNEWNDYFQNYVINPWVKEAQVKRHGFMLPLKDNPRLIYTNVLLKIMHSMGKHMLKSSSIDKIYANKTTYDKTISLDSSFIFFIDSSNINQAYIFNKESLQKELNHNPVTITNEQKYSNNIINFINGNISYVQPTNLNKNYMLNKHLYKQTNCTIKLELLKLFEFKHIDKSGWINTGY